MIEDLPQQMCIHSSFDALNDRVVSCFRCPRLVHFRESVPPQKAFQNEPHWRKPVPGFGDPDASLLILGLAPSTQGGNRTGRIFTGDGSARFLFRILHMAGFANQPFSISKDDELQLKGCYITAAVKCVPPKHKPEKIEWMRCSSYFENEFFLLKKLKSVLALGKFAFDAYKEFLSNNADIDVKQAFVHGKKVVIPGWPTLFGVYHPSPQNTQTGKMTEEMFLQVLEETKKC